MRLLLVHEYYQQPGGEDEVFEATRDLLRATGHQVSEYVRHNSEIASYGLVSLATLALRTTWAWDSRAQLEKLLRQ